MKLRTVHSSFLYFYLFTLNFTSCFAINTETNHMISTAIVVFDPYVSILDKENLFRYNVTDLIPIIHKVATRFSRVLVLLTERDLDQGLQTSRAISPLAIAKYNSLYGNSSSSVVEVWLAYRSILTRAAYRDEYKYHKEPLLLKSHLERLADDANNYFNGTVTTILLPYNMVRLNRENSKLYNTSQLISTNNTKYQWGSIVDATECIYSSYYTSTLKEVQFDVVIISLLEPILLNTPFKAIEETLNNCQNYIPNSTTTGFLVTISDTDTHNTANLTRLVNTWLTIVLWFESRNLEIIFSNAFDTPYEQTVQMKTSGWWRLKENSSYRNSNDYIFEEKAIIAKQVDMIENPENFNWLEKDILFSKPHTGIIFSTYNNKPSEFSPVDVEILIDFIANKFSKIVIYIQDPGRIGNGKLLEEIRHIAKLQGKMEIVALIILPQTTFKRVVPATLEMAANRHNFDKRLFSTYILPYTGNTTFEFATYYKDVVLKNINATDYKIGFAFNTTLCETYFKMDFTNASFINKAFNDAQAIYFLFEEDEETVKLGATRMFLQRVVLLEQCQKLLLATIDNDSTEVITTYVLIHYPIPLTSEFYSSPWCMQNFVKYWTLLNEWVVTTNATLIFNSAIDGKRYYYEREETVSEIGWWRYKDVKTTANQSPWLDKQYEALQLSIKHFPPNASKFILQNEYIVLICVLPLLVIFAIVLYMIRRYYLQMYLSKSDLDEFFLGNLEDDDQNGIYRLPYDKNRYEIDKSSFFIDEGKCLGSGEFGKVFQGQITTSNNDTLKVAVKTNNPKNFHKTTLSGLLSEIKVLAHIGTHKNITELIGAYTKDLKQGKVFIFLEFCHLCSLQNYLRKLRPISDDFNDVSDDGLSNDYTLKVGSVYRMQEYTNTSQKNVLDAELSEDLYRWTKEICEGMAFLATRHVVHADLATRNVLLSINKVVKLCDFGLARRMYNYTNYVKQQQEPLPWKWMSPEALRLLEFNEKTDVWPYGITLWEIYSLGDAPYPGLSWDPNFAPMLERGLRLTEPKYNDKNIYSIMKKCWQKSPERRPTFAELHTDLV